MEPISLISPEHTGHSTESVVLRAAMLIPTPGVRGLDYDCVAIQIMQYQAVCNWQLLVDKVPYTLTSTESIVVIDNDAAWNHPVPDPLNDVFGGSIYIHVNVT